MIYTIKNNNITAKINELGAELISVTDNNGKEFIFQPSLLWPGQAKNLFPNVGLAKDDYSIIRGKRYPMHQHGFAKDMIFNVFDVNDDSVSFYIKSNTATKKYVPYDFRLEISFVIKNNTLKQSFKVINLDKEEIYFGIANHSGFATDTSSYVDFCGNRNIQEICRKGMKYLTGKEKIYSLENGKIFVTPKYFKDGAHILKGFEKKEIILVNPILKTSVKVNFDGFDYITLWSTPDAETVLCMMPWCALPDADDTDHIFEHKQGNVKLDVNSTFMVSQILSFMSI